MLNLITNINYENGWEEIVVSEDATTVQVQNVGSNTLVLKLSDTKPLDTDTLGSRLYNFVEPTSFSLFGGNKLWVRSYPSFASGVLIYSEEGLDLPIGIDNNLYKGLAALTTQNFTEANVKNGVQYETSLYIEDFSGTLGTVVITGSKPVVIKSQYYAYDGLGLLTNVYEAPVYTGGTIREYFNKNKYEPITGESQILSEVNVTSLGTLISAQQAHLGSEGTGNRNISTAGNDALGLETVLAPNKTYLFSHTSLDASDQKLYVYSTWYEGVIS